MKVGILSESAADETGIHILCESVLGEPLERLSPIQIRSRGWSAVFSYLPVAFKALHWRPDADGLIVVVDSDETPIHTIQHEADGFSDSECRYCKLQQMLAKLRRDTSPRAGAPLRVAVGIAVPAIEAWYQCGVDIHCTEARFGRETPANLQNLRRALKRECYGAIQVPQRVMLDKAKEHGDRLRGSVVVLEQHFPSGFGALARSLRAWTESPKI